MFSDAAFRYSELKSSRKDDVAILEFFLYFRKDENKEIFTIPRKGLSHHQIAVILDDICNQTTKIVFNVFLR
jgi:hypothetical protein